MVKEKTDMLQKTDRQLLEQFQLYQKQLQAILLQRENIRLQNLEIEKALEELDASKQEKVYKIAGPIMIEKNIDDLRKELSEKKDDLELRLKTLKSAEERITKKLREMQLKLERMIEK